MEIFIIVVRILTIASILYTFFRINKLLESQAELNKLQSDIHEHQLEWNNIVNEKLKRLEKKNG